jgi:putative redox protein
MHTSKITYLGDLRTTAVHLKSGEGFITDAPVDNSGKGQAFSPTDLAATSLGNCAITVVGIAAQKEEVFFDGTEVFITKIMSIDAPRRISEIKVEFLFKTNIALSPEQKSRFERVAKTCPVALSLHPDIHQDLHFNWSN